MALSAYLILKGQKQGEIHGSVTQKGRENSVLVHSFSHEIVSPRDPATGLSVGKRQHKPLTIVKEIDRSSPLLLQALVTNENLIICELQFWDAALPPAGTDKQIYTIRLTNASIASSRESMRDSEDPASPKLPLHEAISFTYQKVQWIWTDGGITAQDDWNPAI
jgi:type VI secretion system secreted protein Hcp